jgi:NAD(P)-dependent dehydrogenase (short-subunit alcohol dehydrogenase family)
MVPSGKIGILQVLLPRFKSLQITMLYKNSVLITGGTAGPGFQAALVIARQHPEYHIVLASRTDKDSAAKIINVTLKQNNVTFMPIDLASPANVRSFVHKWEAENFPPIIALLLNAGLQFPNELRKTGDGVESTFAINHVGHALLFHLLFSHLTKGARVVITSSGTHDPAQKTGLPDAKYTSAEELAHPPPEAVKISGKQRYATSKLVNILWTYALHRRFEKFPEMALTVTTFDPGLMPGTGLAREYSPVIRAVWNLPVMRRLVSPNIHTPQESGENLARLAIGEDVKGVSGVYYEGYKQIKSSKESYDEAKQEELWAWTVKNVAASKGETETFDIGK